MINWVFLALIGTATLGASNIIDSHLLTKRMGFRVFLMLLAGVILIYALILYYLFPLPPEADARSLLVALGQGAARTVAVVLMLNVFRMEEVSRAVPVVYVYPIFVALMAIPLLGESLNYLDWTAIIIVVAGAVMISTRRNVSGRLVLSKPFLLLLSAGILFALSDVASKYVLSTLSPYNLFWLSAFVMCGLFFLISLHPETFRQFKQIKGRNSAIGLLVLDESISVAGIVLGLLALQLGPVALVSTITSSRPIFVVLFALIMSRAAPGFLDFATGKGLLALRLLASAMIVGGIAIIYLT